MPSTTFVIATYKRTDALRCTLRSLIMQDDPDWVALVIGDHCDEQTATTIRTLRDSRIAYYNLPRRFGEQSGPNTFGLHLVQTQNLAFLNHDDLLLRDHLANSLRAMQHRRLDIHIGRFANVTDRRLNPDGSTTPLATRTLPDPMALRWLLHPDPYVFDPSSFWLIRTAFAKSVGDWKPARCIHRTPWRNWVMRAWRRRGRFGFSAQITGVRFWTQNLRQTGPIYASTTPEHDAFLAWIESQTTEEIRAMLVSQIDEAARTGVVQPFAPPRYSRAQRIWQSGMFLMFGLDPVERNLSRSDSPPGDLLRRITRKRTGENPPEPWDIHDAIQRADEYRVL